MHRRSEVRPDLRGGLPLLLVALLLTAAGCDAVPVDPERTLESARGRVLLVGVTESPPWITRLNGEAAGTEAELVREFARSIDARVRWEWAPADRNLERLEQFELHLVAAGLTAKSPWTTRVALTRPYIRWRGNEHVLAVPPGENAMLTALERWLHGEAAVVSPPDSTAPVGGGGA